MIHCLLVLNFHMRPIFLNHNGKRFQYAMYFVFLHFFMRQLGTKTLVVHVDYYNNIKKEEILKVTI